MMRSKVKNPITSNNFLVKFMRVPLNFAQVVGNCLSLTHPSMFRLSITLVLTTIYIYVSVVSAMDNTTAFLDLIKGFGDILKASAMVFIQFEMYSNTKHLVRCFKKLGAAEFKPSGVTSGFEFWMIKNVTTRILLQVLTLLLSVNPQCNKLSLMYIADNFLNSYISLFFYSPWLIVISLLYFANRQFSIITSRLKESQSFTMSKKGWSEYRNLIRNHAQLCWAIDDLIMWFQRSFLAYSALFFYRWTFAFYEISKNFLSLFARPQPCVVLHFFGASLWQVVRFSDLWLIISSCQAAERNSMKFTSELHEVIRKAGDMNVEGMIKIHFIVKPKVDFWANGFFKIDNTLIHSMIGAAATYLAVVYQSFDLNPSSHDAPDKKATN